MVNLRKPKMFQSILLIDDSEIELQHAAAMLDHIGLSEQIVQRNSVLSAVDYLQELVINRQSFPEIIIIDSKMPLLDGEDFLDIYDLFDQNYRKNIHLIILCGNADSHRIDSFKNNKYVVSVLEKPINYSQLEVALEIIQKKRLQLIGQWIDDNGS